MTYNISFFILQIFKVQISRDEYSRTFFFFLNHSVTESETQNLH